MLQPDPALELEDTPGAEIPRAAGRPAVRYTCGACGRPVARDPSTAAFSWDCRHEGFGVLPRHQAPAPASLERRP